MAVDVYTIVRRAGFSVGVLSEYKQKMDRSSLLSLGDGLKFDHEEPMKILLQPANEPEANVI